MTPEPLKPLLEWALNVEPVIWVLATFTMAVGWVLSLLVAWIRKPRSQSAVRDDHATRLHHAATSQALAATLQALEATEYHRDVLESLQAELNDCIDALKTDPGDSALRSQLNDIEQRLDMAWLDVQTHHRARHSERIDQLNQRLKELQTASPADQPSLETRQDEPIDSALDQTLAAPLTRARDVLKQVTQWHDQPGQERHQATLAALSAIDHQLQPLIASCTQTLDALTDVQRALETLTATAQASQTPPAPSPES